LNRLVTYIYIFEVRVYKPKRTALPYYGLAVTYTH